ncbi:MAG: type II toxin-antitoxin system VapB family antitoxin [Gammaproteobacteria bacterium]|nr:type II toxin-antitoxin system VapB family antitoxin [Gammaproteobacteria bacterium]MDE0612625.1 type II toxin-antitoxin system VapB family antitoxin [Gammaproteobacteria bacterium]
MRTTLNIDETLLAQARLLTDIESKSKLVREALRALVERESARRLAKLGGSQPELLDIPRRRLADDPG